MARMIPLTRSTGDPMNRREFFRFLPVAPVALIAQAKDVPAYLKDGDRLTAAEWNRLVDAVRGR